MPDLDKKSYILLGGKKIEIEEFLSINLNRSMLRISYHVLCTLPDALIGQWVREKIFHVISGRGDNNYFDNSILLARGSDCVYLSTIPDTKISTNVMKIERPVQYPHKIKVKFTIDKDNVESILGKFDGKVFSKNNDLFEEHDELDLDL